MFEGASGKAVNRALVPSLLVLLRYLPLHPPVFLSFLRLKTLTFFFSCILCGKCWTCSEVEVNCVWMCSCFTCLWSVKACLAGLPFNYQPFLLLLPSVAWVGHWIIPRIAPVVFVTEVSPCYEWQRIPLFSTTIHSLNDSPAWYMLCLVLNYLVIIKVVVKLCVRSIWIDKNNSKLWRSTDRLGAQPFFGC